MSSSAVGAPGREWPRPGEAQREPQDRAAGQGGTDVARVLLLAREILHRFLSIHLPGLLKEKRDELRKKSGKKKR